MLFTLESVNFLNLSQILKNLQKRVEKQDRMCYNIMYFNAF